MIYMEKLFMILRHNEKKPLFLWCREMKELNGIRMSHFMPGRVRLKAKPLKGNLPLAKKITEQFLLIDGIKQVEANSLTGSLLIEHEAAELKSPESARLLGEALQQLLPQIDSEKIKSLLKGL